MLINEFQLRNIIKQELKKVLFEQEVFFNTSEQGTINVEFPQDEREAKITISAEELAEIASEMAEKEINQEPFEVY